MSANYIEMISSVKTAITEDGETNRQVGKGGRECSRVLSVG
jgi:hypothetical protein